MISPMRYFQERVDQRDWRFFSRLSIAVLCASLSITLSSVVAAFTAEECRPWRLFLSSFCSGLGVGGILVSLVSWLFQVQYEKLNERLEQQAPKD